ncbi:MAG TPA: tetratricopeptide repeat protein, partial [Gemmatimonadaceae bacterium]|nr:tetratricopeptide repeat protein [Gemmatimonadaceae bacterium]
MSRQALTATGLLAALAGGSGIAGAQAGGGRTVGPGPDTPKILVPTFRIAGATQERGLGVQSADAIRNRVSQEFTAKQLWAISKNDINETLKASGYNPDSALSPSDIKELAKIMRADEIIDGEVEKLPDGQVRVTARMLLARDVGLAQPLGVITARNMADAAKPIAKELSEARKQLKDNRECENHLRGSKFDEAIAAAQKGIAAYPKATLARLCLVSALSAKKAPAADVIKAADDVLAIDANSRIALGLKYGAQKESGNNEGAVETLLAMQKADPTNTTLSGQIATELAQLDPTKAIPLLAKLVADNPGDPAMAKTYWLTLLKANEFKQAVTVGEELAKLDTAAMDSTWFFRMTVAAGADSNHVKAAEYASRAVQKFPRSAGFLALQSQSLRKVGQLPQAVAAMQRAVEIDPKVENGYLSIVLG